MNISGLDLKCEVLYIWTCSYILNKTEVREYVLWKLWTFYSTLASYVYLVIGNWSNLKYSVYYMALVLNKTWKWPLSLPPAVKEYSEWNLRLSKTPPCLSKIPPCLSKVLPIKDSNLFHLFSGLRESVFILIFS